MKKLIITICIIVLCIGCILNNTNALAQKRSYYHYDGNLDFMVWASEGKPLIHYLHELQDILRISGRNRVINNSKYSHEVMVLTKLEYPIYLLPSNNDRSACWYTNK